MNSVYLDTARLLTQVAPLVFVDDTFALKGGTAINLFIRDMPRLSVDLDLAFPDHTLPREQALAHINEAILQASERLKKRGFQIHIPPAAAGETKLLVRRDRMIGELQAGLDEDERKFLLSLVAGKPDWNLMGIAHLEHLPGIRWKLHNLDKLSKTNEAKFAEQADLLASRLAVIV